MKVLPDKKGVLAAEVSNFLGLSLELPEVFVHNNFSNDNL